MAKIFSKNIILFCLCLLILGAPFFVHALPPANADDPFIKTIENITNLLFAVVMIVASVVFVIAGVMFAASGGDPEKTNIAKSTMLWAVIGLVVALMSKGIVYAVKNMFT
ncbi:MAG: pilin [Candidatus Paceibacterota bacterium]